MRYNSGIFRNFSNLLILVIALCTLTICFLLMQAKDNTTKYDVNEYDNYLNEQAFEDGSYSFQIDITDETEDYDLMIRTSLQEMTVSVGDRVIYVYTKSEKDLIGDMPQSQWHLIELESGECDEIITIQYYSSYNGYATNKPLVFYGKAGDLISYITVLTFLTCVIAWISILLGMATILVCYIYKHRDVFHINYLGIFLILFGMWAWGESKTRLFNYATPFVQAQLTFLMVMLIPLPMAMYYRYKVSSKKIKKILDIYGITCLLSTIVGVTLAVAEIVDLVEYMVVSESLLAIGVGIVAWESFMVSDSGKLSKEREWLDKFGVFILLIGTILEMSNIYHNVIIGFGNRIRVSVVLFIIIIFITELIEIREEKDRAIALEEKMKRQLQAARIHILNDKMSPHFIHNTLVAIQELCYSDPEEAARSISIFSKYIRINLDGIGEKRLIPFKKELEYIELYMEIQLMCFEEDIEFQRDLQVTDFEVPPFSIQPIIENAVVHGIRKCLRRGVVKLRTWKEDNMIMIVVEDNGAGFDSEDRNGEIFHSTEAITYRIEQLMGGQIYVSSKPQEGTVVTIQIPVDKKIEVNDD